MAGMEQAIWPLTELAVVTPTLTLRYINDRLAFDLAELAAQGIHDPATMPFGVAWTDAKSPDLERDTLRYYWNARAQNTIDHWDLHFAAVVDGKAVGMCSIKADSFPILRSAGTGSWLGRRYQGQGFGREVRHAALHLIFAGLDAGQATTRAWHDNVASLAVTRALPYTQTSSWRSLRRERADTVVEFTMSRSQWDEVRRNDIEIVGVAAVRAQLGTVRGTSSPAT